MSDNPYANYDSDEGELAEDFGFQKKIVTEADLFSFKNTELPGVPKSERIKKFVVSDKTKILITESNKVYRWRVQKDPEFIYYEIPDPNSEKLFGVFKGKERQLVVRNVFLDPKGYHCLITVDGRHNYYFNYRDSNIRYLNKMFKDINIRCLAFYNPDNERNTGDMIFASDNGVISIGRIEIGDEIVQRINAGVLQISTPQDILSIEVYRLAQKIKSLIVLFTTPSSLFTITGPDDLGLLLTRLDEKTDRAREWTMTRGFNSIGCTNWGKGGRPRTYLWTNGQKLMAFKLPRENEDVSNGWLFKNNQNYRFAKKQDLEDRFAFNLQETPNNMMITDFHYYLLFQDSLTIISRVTQKIVLTWDSKSGPIIDMSFEREKGIIWLYSANSVTKLDTSNEGAEVWKLLIEKKRFEEAYEVSRANNENIEYVAGLYADELFNSGNYRQAAALYVDTQRTLEQIFIKFLRADCDEAREGLEIYIKFWLKKLKSEEKKESQKCLLLAWLIELIVYRLNNLQREAKNEERNPKTRESAQEKRKLIQRKEAELDSLLAENIQVLDENLVYSIMQSHGRINNIVRFAEKKNNYKMIVLHHINEENYKEAISNLKKVKDKRVAEVVELYSHVFFREVVEETTELLINNIRDFKPVPLIGGLMNIPAEKRQIGLDLLKYCIVQLKCRAKSISNIFIFFYATTRKDSSEELVDMLKQKLNFDVEFALRLFKRNHLYEAQIYVYGMMNLYTEAVNLALENGKFALAKKYANKPEFDDVKKKLWLLIAENLLHQGRNVNEVINLTKESRVIKIQDLLPFFNQKIKIEDFKDEICDSLKGYSQEIDRLKKQMESYSSNAEQLKNELRTIKNRCIEIDSSNKCEECFKSLFNQEFYIFPCMHGFHRECLFQAMSQQPTSDSSKINKIETLNRELETLKSKLMQKKKATQKDNTSSFSFNVFGLFGGARRPDQDDNLLSLNREEADIKAKKEEFDELLASECIYCGPSIVDTITMPFSDQSLKQSWSI